MNNNFNLSKIITIAVLVIVVIAVILLLTGEKDNAKLRLNGESNMSIYQYNQFIDPGYEIIDTDNTSGYYINVDGTVNTDVVGTYTLKYLLYNKKGKLVSQTEREVQVLQDNLSNVQMYLKGETEEYFFVNDYVDHGIDVYNNSINVTDRVNVVSNVKTDTAGRYEVHYQITNETTLKETVRTVYIVDYLIEENVDYMNKMINLNINCDNYDYTLFPNGTKYYSKYIHYDFSEIGSYEFDIFLKSGSHKKYIVNIKTIDKEGPVGTCSLSYEKSRTTITMNVTDKSGIKKYSYNGLDFYTNTTIVNSLATNATVRAYDKYDNYTDIKCKAVYGTGFQNINVTSNGNLAGKSGYFVCGTSVSNENKELDLLMQSYGYKTRDAVAAAAVYLANYKYNIPYFWGGKYLNKGLNYQWGCRKSHSKDHSCSVSMADDNSYCGYGLDCTGYTSWAYFQAGFDKSVICTYGQERSKWGNFNANTHKYEFNSANRSYADKIKPGDIVYIPNKHVGIVIGVTKDQVQVAEMRGPIIINIINKSNGNSANKQRGFTGFVLMDEFYKMYGN